MATPAWTSSRCPGWTAPTSSTATSSSRPPSSRQRASDPRASTTVRGTATSPQVMHPSSTEQCSPSSTGADGLALCEDDEGRRSEVMTALVDPLAPGDVVVVHAGTALIRLTPGAA